MYVVLFIIEEKLYRILMDYGQSVSVGTGKKDDVRIEELNNGKVSFSIKKDQLFLSGKKIPGFTDITVRLDDEENKRIVCSSPHMEVRWSRYLGESEKHVKLSYDCQVRIGRSRKNDVVIDIGYVSRAHLIVRCADGEIRVEDTGSTNGLYLNGNRIQKALMRSGDVLDIRFIRIRLVNYELIFENVGNSLQINNIEDRRANNKNADAGVDNIDMQYHRSPRVREELPVEEIVLSHVPGKMRGDFGSRGRFLSLLSSGAMVGATFATGVFSPAMLAMRAAMMVNPVGNAIAGSDKKKKKQNWEQERERFRKYSDYIEAEKAHIEAVAQKQREIINRENPAPKECVQILNAMRSILWERIPTDGDFLKIRIGKGYEDLCVPVLSPNDYNEFRMERDELEDLTDYIIQETRLVDDVAARADLFLYNTIGIIGDRNKVIGLVKNMVISLTTLHYYKDVRIIGIFDQQEESVWSSIRWLPHVWDEDRQTRFLHFEDVDEDTLDNLAAAEKSDYAQFVDRINGILSQRDEKSFREMNKTERPPLPHYILILGSRKKTEHLELMRYLTSNDPLLGVTTLFLYDEQYHLPNACQYIINVDDPYNAQTGSAFSKEAVNKRIWFTLDPAPGGKEFDLFCRFQSAIKIDERTENRDTPSSVTFLQCVNAEDPQAIEIWKNWNANTSEKEVTAPIGKYEGDKTFFIAAPSRQKAHGLVAGMTGSGKSEFLLSWMLSIACRYHPNDVSFIVIDYKGGSMVREIEMIPHVAGVIKDNGEGIRRCFQSLRHEIDRRKDILSKYELKDIDEYIHLFHLGRIEEPLPRLMIVIDEFKELKQEQPEIMKMIDTIARQGSSLGMHLVLATQSPEDAVDEGTWKNTSYQICLRVKSAAASKAMIREPLAAFIAQAGRAYVRIGTDESIETFRLIQTAWSGAPYDPGRKSGGYDVRLVAMSGERIKIVEDSRTRFQSDQTEIEAVCRQLCFVAEKNGVKRSKPLWHTPIPDRFTIKDCRIMGGFDGIEWKERMFPWLCIPIGLYDMPERQEQDIQYMDFSEVGHYGIFGAPGKGKTNLLKTIVTSACTWYTPEEINIYIMDYSSWSMNILQEFPHVGGVVLDGEDEKFIKLMKMLTKELENRKRLFLRHGVDSLAGYRELVSSKLPAILLLIDNFAAVLEQFPDSEQDFLKIIKQGITAGIYLVYTGGNNNGVKYKLYSGISGAIAFELSDKSDYTGLVGQLAGRPLPDRVGRALYKQKIGQRDIQAALYAEGENDKERNAAVRQLAEAMSGCWTGECAERIPVMPEIITAEMMMPYYHVPWQIPAGFESGSIDTAYLDIEHHYSVAVIGKMGCGKSEFMVHLAEMIRHKDPNVQWYIFDSSSKGLEPLRESGVYMTVNEDSVTEALDQIIEELSGRKKAGYDHENDPLTGILIDRLEDFLEKAKEPDQEKMDRILRLSSGLGLFVITSIRLGSLNILNNTDQIARDFISGQTAIALSDCAAQYEFCYRHGLSAEERMSELKDGYALLFQDGGAKKVKLVKEGFSWTG